MTAKMRKYLEYLQSDHWRDLREKKFGEVGKVCQCCTSTKEIHVHHIRYRKFYDCITSDLIVFCCECHDILHLMLKKNKMEPEECELLEAVEMINWFKSKPDYQARLIRMQERRDKKKAKILAGYKPKRRKIFWNGRFIKERLSKKEVHRIRVAVDMLSRSRGDVHYAKELIDITMKMIEMREGDVPDNVVTLPRETIDVPIGRPESESLS